MLTERRSAAELDGRVGPYELIEPLGEGGMAIVYRARHRQSGAYVALKVVRVIEEAYLASFRREIFALRCIEHPQVVGIVDDGVEDGSPWYAMELLEGRTLADYIDDVFQSPRQSTKRPTASRRLDATLTIMRSLCAPLAYVHGAGIVHRDLKPDNVLIAEDGRPILLDFGLALHFGGGEARRDVLDVAGKTLGTPPYMAPEQIRGDLVDARADLYAFGCMLFECITGQPPFDDTPVSTLRRHLAERPCAPSELAPDVPSELDELVLRLLEKRPADRFGFALDVAAALGKLGADNLTPKAAPKARSYLYRPTLSGRDGLLAELNPVLRDRAPREGGCVLIGGQSGVGKTRLAMELATSAARRGAHVVVGQCADQRGLGGNRAVKVAPLQPLRPLLHAIADRCRTLGAAETDRILEDRGPVLSPYAPALAQLAGQHRLAPPPELPADAARFRLVDAFAQCLRRFCEEQSVFVVVDDLQWADELTHAVLAHLDAAFFARTPLFLVGTYRNDEITAALRSLSKSEQVEAVELSPLDTDAVGAMVRDMLALEVPPATLVEFLALESEGNPFFIAEYLRTAIDQGVLFRSEAGDWAVGAAGASSDSLRDALPLPGGLRAVVSRRLEVLEPAARALVDVAAVIGRAMDEEVLVEAAADTDVDKRAALQQLRARQVLEEGDGGDLRFVHDKIRECVYAEIDEHRRPRIHLDVARAIEAAARERGGLTLEYATLAHHFAIGGDALRAIDYLERAGELAISSAASGEAKRIFTSALSLADEHQLHISDRRRAAWERRLGEAHYNLGELAEAKRRLSAGLRRLDPGPPILNTAGALAAQIAKLAGREPRVLTQEEARSRRHEGARAAERLSQVHYFLNEQNQAFGAALRCAQLAAGLGPSPELARAYATLSVAMNFVPVPGLMDRYGDEAERVAASADDPSAAAFVAFLRGLNDCGRGRWADARRYLTASLQLAESTRDVRAAQEIRTLLLDAHAFGGDVDAAFRHCDALLASAEKTRNKQAVAWAKGSMGFTCIMVGEAEDAVRHYAEIDTVAEETGDTTAALVETYRGIAFMLLGDWELARACADQARALSNAAPAAWHCCQGYIAAAEIYLAEWERAIVRGEPVGDLERFATDAVEVLERGARIFPWSLGAALRLRAHHHWLAGHRWRARRGWRRAIDRARHTGMPFEEARAHFEIARHSRGAKRATHGRDAVSIYKRRSATRWADLARELPPCWP